jgi:hypothetical protein
MHFGVFKAFAMTCFGSHMNATLEMFGQKRICSALATLKFRGSLTSQEWQNMSQAADTTHGNMCHQVGPDPKHFIPKFFQKK